MINGSVINGAPINGAALVAAAPPEYIVRGVGYRWRLRLLVGGLDLTAQLTGTPDIDREEGAAGVGGFALYIAPGTPVVPPDWLGQTVSLDYISTTAGITSEARSYTGQIARPVWDPTTRVLSCECSDQLQQRVEALPLEAVESLVGGYWSLDVFEPTEGRSHWDYALERLSTRPASLDCSATGELRVTSWYVTAPHFVFGPGTTIDQSLSLDLAPLSSITNRVEIEFSYRYSRLWQRNQQYTWLHPGTGGSGGIGGFCNWRSGSSDLPTIDMIEDAASGNSQTIITSDYYLLPPTLPDPCGDGSPWINFTGENLLLGANWTAARRWVQTVTETYSLVLATPAGEGETTRIVQRQAYSFEVADPSAEAWADTPPPPGSADGATDLHDETRRAEAINVALRIGQTEIIAGHRAALLSWDVPASMAMGVDLHHTLELNAHGVHAIGKCQRIAHRFDLLSGQAITTLSIAVMRGGGVTDPLTLPALLGTVVVPTEDSGDGLDMPTQLSGFLMPPYDDELVGYAGNLDAGGGEEQFPRRLKVPVDELPASERDEYILTTTQLYRVGIPNNTLEL